MTDPKDYYNKKIYLANVDERDTVIGEVERWEAHEKGILHRGFTAILSYQGQFLLQHRMHPAFDGTWDFTFSSHQVYISGQLQSDIEAIHTALTREWNMHKEDIEGTPVFLGKVLYKAKDPKSIYTEHEWDYIYLARIKKLPDPPKDFMYSYEIIK